MKISRLIFTLVGVSLLLFSCFDNDYDWDNIKKEGVIPLGNLPIGDIELITMESLLSEHLQNELGDNLKVGTDGLYYLEYTGSFGIEAPAIKRIEDTSVSITPARFDNGGNISLSLSPGERREIVRDGDREYELGEPNFDSEDGEWSATVERMTLRDCNFNINFSVLGLSVTESGDNKGYLDIKVVFPDNVGTELTNNTLEEKFPLANLVGNKGALAPVRILSYDYTSGVQELSYSIDIVGGDQTVLSFPDGYFMYEMSFATSSIVPDVIYGDVDFNMTNEDIIAEMGDLTDAFGTNDILHFDNILLHVDMRTNLGANFRAYIEELAAQYSASGLTLSDIGGHNGLKINTPTTPGQNATSSFLFSKDNQAEPGQSFVQADLTPLFNEIPQSLSYKISMSNKDESNKKAFYVYNNLQLEADYKVHIPFSFSRLNISLEDYIMEDVFEDDLAENIFFAAGEFHISADEVEVNVGGSDNDNLEFVLNVALLDYMNNPIDVEITPVVINNSTERLDVVITVEESDIAHLADARHISFAFSARTRDTGDVVSLRTTDSISIKKLKFKTSTGIKYDLD